jgi:V8-like Glu-specific endopeptidase
VSVRVMHVAGRQSGTSQLFDKAVVRFGRAPDNDVVFDANQDREASGHHAEIRREGASWVLVDLRSMNGTYVGGQRVERHALASGDEVSFGAKGPRIRVELMAPVPPVGMHGHPAVTPAPPAGARVGQRTMAMMISSAVAAAAGKVRPKRTIEINAMVEEQVSAATAGQRSAAYVLGALLVVALVALGGLIFWSTRSEDNIQKMREELSKLPPTDPRRKEIEGRLGTLHPPDASFGRNLYDRWKKGIFMLAARGEGFCTAFAVRPSVLATNARCIREAKAKGGSLIAIENEGRGAVKLDVTEMRAHPGYKYEDPNSITPDVGVLTIKGRAAVVLDLATSADLAAVGAGDDVYLIGFPGRLMDVTNPGATFLAAHIGRVTAASGRPAAFAESWLVQHDAGTTRGTNGSPIFNGQGKVIAINAGSYVEEGEEKIAGQKTEVVKDSPYKFGMRIDLIEALLR